MVTVTNTSGKSWSTRTCELPTHARTHARTYVRTHTRQDRHRVGAPPSQDVRPTGDHHVVGFGSRRDPPGVAMRVVVERWRPNVEPLVLRADRIYSPHPCVPNASRSHQGGSRNAQDHGTGFVGDPRRLLVGRQHWPRDQGRGADRAAPRSRGRVRGRIRPDIGLGPVRVAPVPVDAAPAGRRPRGCERPGDRLPRQRGRPGLDGRHPHRRQLHRRHARDQRGRRLHLHQGQPVGWPHRRDRPRRRHRRRRRHGRAEAEEAPEHLRQSPHHPRHRAQARPQRGLRAKPHRLGALPARPLGRGPTTRRRGQPRLLRPEAGVRPDRFPLHRGGRNAGLGQGRRRASRGRRPVARHRTDSPA